jgi:hypothetical protein
MRSPWRSHRGSFSWTTLWVNLGALITVVRYAVGEGVAIGPVAWNPGELDSGLAASVMTTLGGLYMGRRWQEGGEKPNEAPPAS